MKFRLVIENDAEEEITAKVRAPSTLTERIEDLVAAYNGRDKLAVYNDGELCELSVSDIECITVIERKTYAIDCRGVRYRVRARLCELEDELPSYFIRINKSSVANSARILRFCSAFSGAVDVVFKCGYKDYVSRRCFADIKRRF